MKKQKEREKTIIEMFANCTLSSQENRTPESQTFHIEFEPRNGTRNE